MLACKEKAGPPAHGGGSARAAQEFSHLTPACPTLQGAVLLEISEAPGAGTSGFEKGTNSRVQVLLNNEPLEGELCCDLTAWLVFCEEGTCP